MQFKIALNYVKMNILNYSDTECLKKSNDKDILPLSSP